MNGGLSVEDPVCGMTVQEATAKGRVRYRDRDYYFCSVHCAEKFRQAPASYLQSQALSETPVESYVCPMCPQVREFHPAPCPSCGMALEREVVLLSSQTEYICPMHPEVVGSGPGNCPQCGMVLEANVPSSERPDDSELHDMTRRLWVTLILTLAIFFLAMVPMVLTRLAPVISVRSNQWIQLLLSTPVVLLGGWPFFQRAWNSIVLARLNMFTLIGIGTAAAYLYSLAGVLRPEMFPRVYEVNRAKWASISKQLRRL